MTHSIWSERSLALSAVFQAASLVDDLAKTGHISAGDLQIMADSLLVREASTAIAVYRDTANLQVGVTALTRMLKRKRMKNIDDILRYVMSLLYLQRKLLKNKDMIKVVANRLDHAANQLEHFASNHDNVIANLADIYTDTISTFRFRVQVTGDHNYLTQQRIANQIRVLLFSGIRAAMLWKQFGGSRFHLLFYRKRLLDNLPSLRL